MHQAVAYEALFHQEVENEASFSKSLKDLEVLAVKELYPLKISDEKDDSSDQGCLSQLRGSRLASLQLAPANSLTD